MNDDVESMFSALKAAVRAVSKFFGPIVRWLLEFATNVSPLVIAAYLGYLHLDRFLDVRTAVVFGLVATTLAVLPQFLLSRERSKPKTMKRRRVSFVETLEKMQPAVDKLSWLFMAVVLLFSAVDATNNAFYPDTGIDGLTNFVYNFSFATDWHFTTLDILSLAFGLATILLPLSFASVALSLHVNDERTLQRLVAWSMVPFAVLALAFSFLLKNVLTSHGLPHPEPFMMAQANPELEWAALGIALFFIGYLGNHRTLFELNPFRCRLTVKPTPEEDTDELGEEEPLENRAPPREQVGLWTEDDHLLWLRTLRALVFEAVVLPPIIVAIATVSGTLTPATVVVYGVFVYSGFSVWNLSAKVVNEARLRVVGLWAVLVQFGYAFLMTVLWSILFWQLKVQVKADPVFDVALRIATAAVLIQVVFGPVYRNAWGRSLSDRWLLEGPEYAVVATIVCLGLGAMPVGSQKLQWVVFLVTLLIVVPAWLLRRSLTAYVLIRVLPGRTAEVRKALTAAEVDSAVLYGDYDILAKLEVPGRPKLFRENADEDGRNLAVLAALVKSVIRRGGLGVRETQTLLDFSNFVHQPSIDVLQVAVEPDEEPMEQKEFGAQPRAGGRDNADML